MAVSTISALRPFIVPTLILPAQNSSSFSVWILFFLRRSHNSPRWQDHSRSHLPTQPRPGPAATRLLVLAIAEISIRPVMRKEWGEVFTCGPPLDPNHNLEIQDLTHAAVSRRQCKNHQSRFWTGGRDWNPCCILASNTWYNACVSTKGRALLLPGVALHQQDATDQEGSLEDIPPPPPTILGSQAFPFKIYCNFNIEPHCFPGSQLNAERRLRPSPWAFLKLCFTPKSEMIQAIMKLPGWLAPMQV